MATFYPYPPSQFDRDHYGSHRSHQQQWHNSFQTSFYDDYDDQSAWSNGSAILSNGNPGQPQAGSSGSCSYTMGSGILTTPRSIYPVEAAYRELDFCNSPTNSSGSSLPATQEDQLTLSDDTRPSSTRPPTSASSHVDEEMKTDEELVVVKQEDDTSCFIMELSAPQVQSTLVSQSLAPPIEVPLRATHASRKMRSMMSSFRCNPFAMHAGGDSAMAPDREEAKPHEEEPLIFEFQLEHYLHDCPFSECDSDLLILPLSCDDSDEKKCPTLPKQPLRAFSPSFELHSDSASAFGIPSENEFDPATSASSASMSDHIGSEWGDYDLESPGSASKCAPSEEASSLSHRSARDHDHNARGRGLAQARLIKPSSARAQSWDYNHASPTSSRLLTGHREPSNAGSYQDYQSDDSATASQLPTPSDPGLPFRVPHSPTTSTPRPVSVRPSSATANGKKRTYEDISKGQLYVPTGHAHLSGPGRNATLDSRQINSRRNGSSATGFGAVQNLYSEASSLINSPSSPTLPPTTEGSHRTSLSASHFTSRPLPASFGLHPTGGSNSPAPSGQWSPTKSSGLHYSASGMPGHTIGMPMSLNPRNCATAFDNTSTATGLSGTSIATLPPLTSAHRRWSLPDNVSTSHPQSYQAGFLA